MTLKRNQVGVLKGLEVIATSYRLMPDKLWTQHAIRDLYFYIGMADADTLASQTMSKMVKDYHKLNSIEFLEVLQEFTGLALELEEKKEPTPVAPDVSH